MKIAALPPDLPTEPVGLVALAEARHAAGSPDEAALLLERAVMAAPRDGRLRRRLAAMLGIAGRKVEAETHALVGLGLGPVDGEIWNLIGTLRRERGDLTAARMAYATALERDPKFARAAINLAQLLPSDAEPAHQVAAWRRAVALDPARARNHLQLAAALDRAGDKTGAIAAYRAALARQPDHAEAWNALGLLLGAHGSGDEALDCFHRALALKPALAVAAINLASLLSERGDHEAAAAAGRRAVAINPALPEGWFNLGQALLALKDYAGAVDALSRRASLGKDAVALNALAVALQECDRLEAAIATLEEARELLPGSAEIASNLANFLTTAGRYDEAEAMHKAAIAAEPMRADAHNNYAMLLMAHGRMEEGWREYEWRWRAPAFADRPRRLIAPVWRGEPLAGKHILLQAEQGLGDAIQYLRFVERILGEGATVTVETVKPLFPLVGWLGLPVRCVAPSEMPEPRPDFQISLMSLPHALKLHHIEETPRKFPYLRLDPARIEAWRQRMAELPRPFFGISWTGSPRYAGNRYRTIPLTVWAPFLRRLPGTVFALSKGEQNGEIAAAGLGDRILDWSAEMDEAGAFVDTAPLIANLDCVLTVDTVATHLAGALGAPVALLLPQPCDYRWLLDRADSPWYPTVRLFRQQRGEGWAPVLERLQSWLSKEGWKELIP